MLVTLGREAGRYDREDTYSFWLCCFMTCYMYQILSQYKYNAKKWSWRVVGPVYLTHTLSSGLEELMNWKSVSSGNSSYYLLWLGKGKGKTKAEELFPNTPSTANFCPPLPETGMGSMRPSRNLHSFSTHLPTPSLPGLMHWGSGEKVRHTPTSRQ